MARARHWSAALRAATTTLAASPTGTKSRRWCNCKLKHILEYLYLCTCHTHHHVSGVQVRHAGDMGNILAGEDGVARVDLGLEEELTALLNRCLHLLSASYNHRTSDYWRVAGR